MSADTGWRITEGGEAQAYRVTADGYYRAVIADDDPPPPPPEEMAALLRVRRMIYDPKARAGRLAWPRSAASALFAGIVFYQFFPINNSVFITKCFNKLMLKNIGLVR
ncbi:MAG: hypothetical protein LBC53_09530 [Spirochaetaceae bacterium]|jgi:hypothetical protein|nr:hypothetical protein [Spirochaetaceae bacterium]